jgi:putative addiction module component (TIGR02574 family)
MSTQAQKVLNEALRFPPVERAELVEKILANFTFPRRQGVDAQWSTEVEERIEAYERGELKSDSAGAVFERLQRDAP